MYENSSNNIKICFTDTENPPPLTSLHTENRLKSLAYKFPDTFTRIKPGKFKTENS